MSHSGWDTKTVAENTGPSQQVGFWQELHETKAKLKKLEAEAAGMRAALEAIKRDPYGCPMCDSGELRDANKSHWDSCGYPKMWAALSGEAGREILREMGRLKDLDRLKGELDQEKATNRDWAEMMRGANFRLQGELNEAQRRWETLNDQLLEANKQAVDAKAKLAEVNKSQQHHATDGQACWWKGQTERLKHRLETAQKELATLKNTMVPLARYDELKNALDRAGYVPRSEVSRAVEDEREKLKAQCAALARACWDARALIKRAGLGYGRRWPESINALKVEEAHNVLDAALHRSDAEAAREFVHRDEVEKVKQSNKERIAEIENRMHQQAWRPELEWKAEVSRAVEAERERCIRAASNALLPDGYQWGDEAIGQFKFGSKMAAEAIRARGKG